MSMIKKKKQTINLLNNINNILINNNLIKENQCILISISGGQDSICIFFILLQLKRQWKWAFGIIFCNHLWQKSVFSANLLVVQLAHIFKIPVYCTITPNKAFNEHQSRYWRYNIFYRISCFYNYNIITTGHSSSDKVETILFQLTRGSSTKSLTSLNFIKYFLSTNNFSKNTRIQTQYLYNSIQFQKIKTYKLFYENYSFRIFAKKTNKLNTLLTTRLLVRPILNFHRFDLQKLSNFWNLPIYPDISNVKMYYYRNRIRKQLLPTLRFFFNPQIDTILLQFAEIITTEQIYVDILLTRLQFEFQTKKNKIFQLNISLFYGIPLAIQRKLIKKFLENYSYKQVYFFQIEYIIDVVIKKNFYIFNKYFIEQKKLKKNFFYPIDLNFTILNLTQFEWIRFRNKKKKKKITTLNIYLINKEIYTYITGKKMLSCKYIIFLKKQFFISSINKILLKEKHLNYICNLDNQQYFSTYLTIYFFSLKKNKQTKRFLKNGTKKKNTFNFIKLSKKTNLSKKKIQLNASKLFYSQVMKSNLLNKEILNFSFSSYYFQKFKIFFYPEIGILFRIKTELIIFDN